MIPVGRLTITLRRASNQFQIDWDKQVAICPKEHQSQTWSEKVDESGQPIIDFSPVSLPCLSFQELIPLTWETRCMNRREGGKHQNILLGIPIEQRVVDTCVETKRKTALAGSGVQLPRIGLPLGFLPLKCRFLLCGRIPLVRSFLRNQLASYPMSAARVLGRRLGLPRLRVANRI